MWDQSDIEEVFTFEVYRNFCNSVRILNLEMIVDVFRNNSLGTMVIKPIALHPF